MVVNRVICALDLGILEPQPLMDHILPLEWIHLLICVFIIHPFNFRSGVMTLGYWLVSTFLNPQQEVWVISFGPMGF